jgi:tape measure domain-containing protein
MAQDVGTVYVQVEPSGRGFGKKIEGDIGGSIDSVSAKGSTSLMSKLGTAFGKIGKVGVATVGAITTGIVGLAAKGGFDRALAIEQAQAKLKGLGHDSKSVKGIMSDALAAVKGTAFGLGDAATVAASLTASGVKQGGQLTKVLKTVADTAQISGRSLTDIGAIFGSVAARGKLQGDDMLQLMSSGIPVLQMLGKHLGKTSSEVSEMVSKGKIDFQTFADAMEEGLGGAALSAGTTFTGALNNVKAALSRMGEKIAQPVLNGLRELFNQSIPLIDSFTNTVTPLMEKVGGALQRGLETALPNIGRLVEQAKALLSPLASPFGKLAEQAGFVFSQISEYAQDMWNAVRDIFSGAVRIVSSVLDTISDAVGQLTGHAIVSEIAKQVANALQALGDAVQWVADHMDKIKPIIGIIGGVVLASKGLSAVSGGLGAVAAGAGKIAKTATSIASWVDKAMEMGGIVPGLKQIASSMNLVKNAQAAWMGITKAATAIQVAFNAVMAANPLGLIVIAIAAVVGALAIFFTQTEVGRKAWASFIDWLKQAWQSVGTFFSGLWDSIQSVFKTAVDLITGFLSSKFGQAILVVFAPFIGIPNLIYQNWSKISGFFRDLWESIKNVWGTASNWFSGVWDAVGNGIKTAWNAITNWLRGAMKIVQDVVANVWTVIGAMIVWPLQQIQNGINAVFGWITTFISTQMNETSGIMKTVWTVIYNIVNTAWTLISNIVSTVTNYIRMGIVVVLNLIKGDWQGAWTTITTFFQDTWNGIVSFFTPAITLLKDTLTTALAAIQTAWNQIWSAINSFFQNTWNAISGFFTPKIQWLLTTINTALAAIQNTWNQIWSAINSFFSGIWNAIVSYVSVKVNELQNWVVNTANSISAAWSGIWNGIKTYFQGIWNAMVGYVSAKITEIGAQVGRIYGIVTGALSGAGQWLVDTGKQIVSGLIKGIEGAFGRLKETISQMGNNVLDWAKGVLGIPSPSRLMRDQVGIDRGQKFVNDALEDTVDSVNFSNYAIGLPNIHAPDIDEVKLRSALKGSVLHEFYAGAPAWRGDEASAGKNVNVAVNIDAKNSNPDVLYAMFETRVRAAAERW